MCLFESWAWQRQCSHCERINDLTGGRSNHSHFNSRKHTHTHTIFNLQCPSSWGWHLFPWQHYQWGSNQGQQVIPSHRLFILIAQVLTFGAVSLCTCSSLNNFFPGCTFSPSIDFSRSVSRLITHMQRGNAHTHTHTYEVHSMALSKYESIKTFLGLYFSSMHQAVFCILHKNTTSVLFITAITMS